MSDLGNIDITYKEGKAEKKKKSDNSEPKVSTEKWANDWIDNWNKNWELNNQIDNFSSSTDNWINDWLAKETDEIWKKT